MCSVSATVPLGIEHIAAEEAREVMGLPHEDVVCVPGGIAVTLPVEKLPLALKLRCVENVHLTVASIPNLETYAQDVHGVTIEPYRGKPCRTWEPGTKFAVSETHHAIVAGATPATMTILDYLGTRLVSSIDWSKPLALWRHVVGCQNEPLSFRVTCTRSGSHTFMSMEAAWVFGSCITDTLGWTVNLEKPDLEVVLRLRDSNARHQLMPQELTATISYALTHSTLARRNIAHAGRTSLRGGICNTLIRVARPLPGEVVYDAFGGGGNIAIEGVLSLAWPGVYFLTGDLERQNVRRTAANVKHIDEGEHYKIEVCGADATRLPLRTGSIDAFVSDLVCTYDAIDMCY